MLKRPAENHIAKSANKPATTTNEGDSKAVAQPVNKDWRPLFERGKNAFANGQYKEAIDAFTLAISINTTSVTLLDCRAAAYEKCGDLTLGLRDAQTMIKLAPASSRGYLRAGKLFTLQKKYKNALAIYERAIKSVPQSDARYSVLLGLRKEMATKERQRLASSHDFVKILPYDIVADIFSRLSFERRFRCMTVCRSWRNFLMHWPGMWREMLFGAHKIPARLLAHYMSFVNGRHVRKFSFDGDRNRVKNALKLLVERDCHYLESLELIFSEVPVDQFLRTLRLMGKNLKELKLRGTDLSVEVMFNDVLKQNPTITRVELLDMTYQTILGEDHLPPLISFDKHVNLERFRYVGTYAGHKLIQTLRRCPNLRELSLGLTRFDSHPELLERALQYWPKLAALYLDAEDNTNWYPLPLSTESGLRVLFIRERCHVDQDILISLINANHTTLEILCLTGVTGLRRNFCLALASSAPARLREVYLDDSPFYQEDDLCLLVQKCPMLEIVSMPSQSAVTNRVLHCLSQLESLKRLDVNNCQSITGVGVRALVDNSSSLQSLCLNNCHHVRHDAVAYAREKLGRHNVEYRFT